jgi:uncharacterized membrane protein YhiD involved in acid resistance
MKNTKLINLSGIVIILVLVIFGAGYFFLSQRANPKPVSAVETQNTEAKVQPSGTTAAGGMEGNPFFPPNSSAAATQNSDTYTGSSAEIAEIILRLFLAVILSAILAFRPRKNVPLFRRNLYVAQTQILLAVVAAALMMIVGDNAARAFAIFAAVSLVRFRTNIRDPKEITVLLISLALGLAAGVGRWELGLALCLFALALLWVLEFREPEQVTRSMQLTVKTRNTESTQDTLKRIFDRHQLEAEVRQIDPPDEANPVGCIMYYVNLRLNLTTDSLSDTIFNADQANVDGISWEQKKDASYIYQ